MSCYLVVTQRGAPGCYAIQMEFGEHLYEFEKSLCEELQWKTTHLQVVTLNPPESYGEYAPYHFCNTEEEFKQKALEMRDRILSQS